MFDIGFSEIALVGIVALLVVGPKRLPEIARTAGKWIGKTRRMIESVKADIDREFKTDELRKLLTEQQAEVQQLRQIVEDSRTAIEKDIERATADPEAAKQAALPTAPPLSGSQPPATQVAVAEASEANHGSPR
ncbi:MAG TPA: Sec-independent protein translocase protein TatB [Gammaproteobacteria bacterium]|nr:Sec-independent protein translocase protein TatB [Gammaproteobacteria bacterium]